MASSEAIIVFDGLCNFCSHGIKFILKNDRSTELRFTTIQSTVGSQLLKTHGISSVDPNTFLFILNGEAFVKSDAAIKIARYLGPWRILQLSRFLPRRLRDSIYSLIARNRYKWFGKRDTCFLPTPDERSRFMDD